MSRRSNWRPYGYQYTLEQKNAVPKNMVMPADMSPGWGGTELGTGVVGSRMITQPTTETEWLMMDAPGMEQPPIESDEAAVKAEAIVDSLTEAIVAEAGERRGHQIIEAMMLVYGEGYSIRQAAELMGVSKSHVHNLATEGVEIARRGQIGT